MANPPFKANKTGVAAKNWMMIQGGEATEVRQQRNGQFTGGFKPWRANFQKMVWLDLFGQMAPLSGGGRKNISNQKKSL